MNALETMGFSYRLIFSTVDLAAWCWALFFFLLACVAIGLFWGLVWNRTWSLLNHLGSAFFSGLTGLLLLAAVLAWFGADRTSEWLEAQRVNLPRQLASSGAANREAFRNAWDKLEPLGGQENMLPPAQGGNELRLNSDDDARSLAATAADAIKRPLLDQAPFSFGVPCTVRDADTVGSEVVEAIARSKYPVVVTPANEWSRAAVTAQVGTALDYAAKTLAPRVQSQKTALAWLIGVLLIFQFALIPIFAISDIQENPRV